MCCESFTMLTFLLLMIYSDTDHLAAFHWCIAGYDTNTQDWGQHILPRELEALHNNMRLLMAVSNVY